MNIRTHKKSSLGEPEAKEDYGFAVSLMQFLVVPAFVLDAHGRVLIWNKACERLTGIDAVEIVGTKEHWRGFYDSYRPCLSDLIVHNRVDEMAGLYAVQDAGTDSRYGIQAQNWCVMPRLGTERYLYIDAGPIFDTNGKLLAVVETLRDMTVQKRAQLELEMLAVHDGLTGIFNRRGFDNAMLIAWSSAARNNSPLALLMVDVDHFKRFNDTYGHQAGDECLKAIASVLEETVLRPTDIVARYGGEEFAVILPSADQHGVGLVATRIVEAVSGLKIAHAGGVDGRVTVSVGAAITILGTHTAPEELIQLADKSLYEAKRLGRNQVAMCTNPAGR